MPIKEIQWVLGKVDDMIKDSNNEEYKSGLVRASEILDRAVKWFLDDEDASVRNAMLALNWAYHNIYKEVQPESVSYRYGLQDVLSYISSALIHLGMMKVSDKEWTAIHEESLALDGVIK